jgi:6-phosphogluconolactonase/glucosamine-6-phosphate isomerase/deaminase
VAICLFFGSEKKAALEMFRDPKIEVEQCPAKLVLESPEPYIVTDSEQPQGKPWGIVGIATQRILNNLSCL